MTDERASRARLRQPFKEPDDTTRAALEARNGLRQFDRLVELIDAGVAAGRFRMRPSQVLELNRFAVDGLVAAPGAFRQDEIEISNTEHRPPAAQLVPELVDEMCEYVNDSWEDETALTLSAYVMWRVNWIHPFADGNGRTSRALSYLVLCVRTGYRLPGAPTIPERIASDKFPYYHALDAADTAWKSGRVDVSAMEALLGDHLAAQLVAVFEAAGGRPDDPTKPRG